MGLGIAPAPASAGVSPNWNQECVYGIEHGMGKMMKGMFNGALGKMRKGKKLFTSRVKQDGNGTTIGADFLLDGQGTVVKAHYGAYLGDHLTPAEVLAAAGTL